MSELGAHARRQVFLHVGAMRSGTTFLQQLLSHHREALAADGVLFPGEGQYGRQVAAVREVVDLPGPLSAAELDGAWARLCAEIAAWDGDRCIVSVAQLSLARTAHVQTVTADLAAADVHVVLTARDLGRVLPSSWQESVQNGSTRTWPEHVAAVLDDSSGGTAEQRFWRQQDLVRIVGRWSTAVPVTRIHLVTVPPAASPPEELWHRFCRAVGLDPQRYPPPESSSATNRSLGRPAVEMLRRLNLRLEDQLAPAEYVRCVKRPVARRALGRLPYAPISVPPEHSARLVERSAEMVADLRASGVDVVGSLADLRPSATASDCEPAVVAPGPDRARAVADPPGGPARVDAEQIAAAATASAVSLLKALADGRTTVTPATDGAS